MPVAYDYPISDTLNGEVWPALLRSQVLAAILAAPFRNIEVRWDAGTITVWFDAPLSTAEELILNTLIANHNGTGPQDFSGFINTLTAAPTVLLAIPTVDNKAYDIDLRVSARRLDVGKAFGKRMGVTIRRGTGPASLVVIGSTTLYAHLEAPIAWTADVLPNLVTGNIEVIVVGAVASPVNWWAYANVVEV